LSATASADARKALTQLLMKLNGGLFHEVRAVEALQRNGTPEGRKCLKEFAAGESTARLTREARGVLPRR
jgi:hypothetical protein